LVDGCVAWQRKRSLLRSFTRSLRARNRSPKTIAGHLEAARLLAEHAGGADVLTLTRADIDGFVADQLSRHRPTTAAVRFRSLQQFYRWAVEEEFLQTSPMTGLRPPSIPDAPVPILDERSIKALLAAMNGRGFDDRRDTAIVRLFLDTGMRVSEMAGLSVADIDLGMDAVVSARAVGRVRVPLARRPARQSSATSESE
jgi:site-specific recombinase XerD